MTRRWRLLPALVLLLSACQHPPAPYPTQDLPVPSTWTEPDAPTLPLNGELALDQTLFLVLARNPDLAAERLTPAREAEQVRLEEAVFAPEIFAGIRTGEETSSETSRSTGERFAVEAEQRGTDLGIRRRFDTGTEVDLFVEESRDASNRAPTQQEVRAGVDVTQALLRGSGRDVNRVSVRQAQLGIRVSEEELRGYTQALLASAEEAYWRYALATEAVRITEQALEVAEQQLAEVQARIEVGRLARNQEAAALAESAQRRQDLIEAEAESDRQRLLLLNVVAVPGFLQPITTTSTVDLPPLDPGTPESWIAQAHRLRPDLREARLRREQNRLEVVRTRNGLQPRLDFFASLAKTGFGEDLGEATSEFSGDTYEWSAGLLFLHELGNESAEALDRTARIRVEQADLAIHNLEQVAETEVRLALVELNRARKQIEAGQVTQGLRKETLRAERERFEVGDTTSLVVAQAQRDLLETQIDLLRARVATRTALIRLHTATGLYLSWRRVETHTAE